MEHLLSPTDKNEKQIVQTKQKHVKTKKSLKALERNDGLSVWHSDTALGRRINEVTPRRARLVLEWTSVFGRAYHHGM